MFNNSRNLRKKEPTNVDAISKMLYPALLTAGAS